MLSGAALAIARACAVARALVRDDIAALPCGAVAVRVAAGNTRATVAAHAVSTVGIGAAAAFGARSGATLAATAALRVDRARAAVRAFVSRGVAALAGEAIGARAAMAAADAVAARLFGRALGARRAAAVLGTALVQHEVTAAAGQTIRVGAALAERAASLAADVTRAALVVAGAWASVGVAPVGHGIAALTRQALRVGAAVARYALKDR